MKRLLVVCFMLAACAGPKGDSGMNGANGSNGKDGLNGSTVTSVQFCSDTTTYPSEFNEIGFCIGNKLYAVYSANDGFLTYLPPGVYSSNAVGSKCSFTVLANCVIKN